MDKLFKPDSIKRLIESKEAEKVCDCILSVELKAEPIGEGGNGLVYIPKDEMLGSVCIKKIKEKPQIFYNSIDEEHKYQEKLNKIGVRTPMTLISFKDKNDGQEYFIMERINGHSVKDILKDENLMPKNFEYNKFCRSLEDQIKKMHNANGLSEGIHHRDLHEGNVMIDEEGLAVIIDFGTATEGTGSDFTYEESVQMFNEKKGRYDFVNGYFKDDNEMVKNIKSSLKKFIKLDL